MHDISYSSATTLSTGSVQALRGRLAAKKKRVSPLTQTYTVVKFFCSFVVLFLALWKIFFRTALEFRQRPPCSDTS